MKSAATLKDAYALFHAGALCLADMEHNGFRIDTAYLDRAMIDVGNRVRELERELKEDEVYKTWRKQYGDRTNINSRGQLSVVLFDVLGHKPVGETAGSTQEKRRWKSDKNALATVDIPFVKQYLRLAPLKKVLDANLTGIKRNTVDGYFHPNFNLHVARTYRSSSGADKESGWNTSDVNVQNQNVRDKEIAEIVRRCFIARDGHQLVENDFKTLEVHIGQAYHRDPVMSKYLHDPKTDMHKDVAQQLFLCGADQVSKMMRFSAKSFFVFAQFYGDWYIHCAKGLWDSIDTLKLTLADGTPLKKHLRGKGIREPGDLDPQQRPKDGTFEKVVKDAESDLWGNRFKIYAQWKKDWWAAYQERGYFDSLTGFRFWGNSGKTGFISKNDSANWPIQGCLSESSKVLTENGWLPIKELVGVQTKVWTGFKWADAVGLDRGLCKRARISLSSGLSVECDIRHKLKNELDEWVDFDKLKVGNWVALPGVRKVVTPSDKITWPFVFGFIVGDGYLTLRNRRKKPSELLPEMVKLSSAGLNQRQIGKKLGVSHTTVRLSMNKEAAAEKRKSVTISVGRIKRKDLSRIHSFLVEQGYTPRKRTIKKIGQEDMYSISLEDKKFVQFLESKGFVFGWKAETKRVPQSVWSMGLQEQRDFMEGLWKSDGGRAEYGKRNLHMCNLDLLKEVQILMSAVGFDSNICKTGTGWLLRVRWRKGKATGKRQYPISALAGRVTEIKSANYQDKNQYINDERTLKNRVGREIISQDVAERMIERNGSGSYYRYDKIEKIEILDAVERTYTMSVDDPLHQFVADGVIHKNSAFHCLLWVLIQLQRWLKKSKMRSVLVAQVHDSGNGDVHESELQDYLGKVKELVEVDLPKHWPWICTPMTVEAEVSPLGGSWWEKREWVLNKGIWGPAV